MYTTSDNKFGSPTFDKAAASIGVAGVKKSEEIWTGKDVYVLNKGRWIDMHTNFAEMNNGREDDPDAKKAHEAERCETLPDETVFGQSAAVYQIHDPVLGNDTKIWVSKSNHLPIKSESTTHTGQATFFASSRYDYDNVQAPANSISMPDILRRK